MRVRWGACGGRSGSGAALVVVACVPAFAGGRSGRCVPSGSGRILYYFANVSKMGSAPTYAHTHAPTYAHTHIHAQ